MHRKIGLMILILCSAMGWAFAQNQSLLLDKNQSTLVIKGDSTLHEWEMVAEQYSGEAHISENHISHIDFKAEAESLESGKGKMNSLTYEALKSDKNPEIIFTVYQVIAYDEGYTLTGTLEIAGVKKEIQIKAQGTLKKNHLELHGSYIIDMTQYDMTPPKAVFGTIVVEKEIEVVFNLTFTE
jgi:polyisoprenoid-binding protein YceI